MQRENHPWIRRPTPEQILLALQRFAGQSNPPTRTDLDLLIQEASRVGLQTLSRGQFRLTACYDLSDLGFGMDAVVEAFRGAPECPKLREIALKITSQTGGSAEAASNYFRNIMAKYAGNHAKSLLEGLDKARHHIERAVRDAIPRTMQRHGRIYFLPARAQWQPSMPSEVHIEELRLRCGAGEGRGPHLVAATRAILDENRQYAPWLHIKQVVEDYLAIMTMGNRLPGPEASVGLRGVSEDNPDAALESDRMLQFLESEGFAAVGQKFLSRTALPRDDAEAVWDAFREYQRARFHGEAGPDDRFDFLAKRMPGLTRARFRQTYRPTMDRLQAELYDLLRKRFGWDGPSDDPEGGDEA